MCELRARGSEAEGSGRLTFYGMDGLDIVTLDRQVILGTLANVCREALWAIRGTSRKKQAALCAIVCQKSSNRRSGSKFQ